MEFGEVGSKLVQSVTYLFIFRSLEVALSVARGLSEASEMGLSDLCALSALILLLFAL
jgi:hypothetical protein